MMKNDYQIDTTPSLAFAEPSYLVNKACSDFCESQGIDSKQELYYVRRLLTRLIAQQMESVGNMLSQTELNEIQDYCFLYLVASDAEMRQQAEDALNKRQHQQLLQEIDGLIDML